MVTFTINEIKCNTPSMIYIYIYIMHGSEGGYGVNNTERNKKCKKLDKITGSPTTPIFTCLRWFMKVSSCWSTLRSVCAGSIGFQSHCSQCLCNATANSSVPKNSSVTLCISWPLCQANLNRQKKTPSTRLHNGNWSVCKSRSLINVFNLVLSGFRYY